MTTGFGMTDTEYDYIRWIVQGNVCPICDKLLVSGNIVIDHLHGTDIIRGVLHPKCNSNILGQNYETKGLTNNPKFEEYKRRNPLEREAVNDPPLVLNSGSGN